MDVSGRGDSKKREEDYGQKRASSNEDSRNTKNPISSTKPQVKSGKEAVQHPKSDRGKKKSHGRVRFLDHMPMSQILKEDLKVVIVDKIASDLRINSDNYSRVKKAIFTALYEWIKKHQGCAAPIFELNEVNGLLVVTDSSVVICVDSQAAIKAVGSNATSSSLVRL